MSISAIGGGSARVRPQSPRFAKLRSRAPRAAGTCTAAACTVSPPPHPAATAMTPHAPMPRQLPTADALHDRIPVTRAMRRGLQWVVRAIEEAPQEWRRAISSANRSLDACVEKVHSRGVERRGASCGPHRRSSRAERSARPPRAPCAAARFCPPCMTSLRQGAADDHADGVVAVVGDVGVAAGVDRDRARVVQSGGRRGAAVAGEIVVAPVPASRRTFPAASMYNT